MEGTKWVKSYQSNKEYLVLSLVRKYPLSSLNKLSEELPGISRHSIQRILEKNNLSTVEKRLEFSGQKRLILPSLENIKGAFLGFLKQIRGCLENILKRFPEKPTLKTQLVRNLVIFGLLVLSLRMGLGIILGKSPEIFLDQPNTDFTNKGEKLFVNGKVFPKNSLVKVNGSEASLNGDGSFTALVSIPLGKSTVKVEAFNNLSLRKKAQVLRLVSRVLTEEEIKAEEESEAKKKREAIDKVAQLEKTVNDLLAVKNAASEKKQNLLKILNSHLNEQAGFFSVVGEVVNLGKESASWVMITANFFNEGGNVVDTKYGFATDFGQVIKSGQFSSFETQPTTKPFHHYSLALSWEESVVAGVATGGDEATVPGQTKKE